MVRRIQNGNGKQEHPVEVTAGVASTESQTMVVDQKRMILSAIKKSEKSDTEKIVLYASEGWGKTTWASCADKPVFISTEDGLKSVTVDAFPEPKTWQDVFDAIDVLRSESHQFKTLVIDTADWTEHLCHKFLLQRDHKDSIADYSHGRGYVLAFEEWKKLDRPLY